MMKELKNLGLEKNEIKIYLALLELGSSSVSKITKKAKITRTLGYHILKKLEQFELIKKISNKNEKIIYSAKHPQKLIRFAKNKKKQWDNKIKNIKEYMPNLICLYKTDNKPIIYYQNGIDGLKKIYTDMLNSKTDILSFLNEDIWLKPNLHKFNKWYIKQRIKRKIINNILITNNKIIQNKFSKFTNYKLVNPNQLSNISNLNGEFNIYENKILFINFEKNKITSILIENQFLANFMKTLHQLIWNINKIKSL